MNIKKQAKLDAKLSVRNLGWTLTEQWLTGLLAEVRDRIRAQSVDRAAAVAAAVTANLIELKGAGEGATFVEYLRNYQ